MTTEIQWADETFNPWWGCERVSPACAHCYADTLARHRAPGQRLWGAGHGFRFMSESTWKLPLAWARRSAREGRSRYGGRQDERIRVFCASMADVFEDRPELLEPRKRLADLIYATPELDWLLLTKRPENVGRMLGPDGVGLYAVDRGTVPCPQPNVWVGVSIENSRYTWRADVLRGIPAAVRFISAEPLLGSLIAGNGGAKYAGSHPDPMSERASPAPRARASLDLTGIDWLIIGGESGGRARRTDPDWIAELVATPGPAIFVKQLGRVLARELALRDGARGGDIGEWPDWLRVREFPHVAAPA